jgi:hypothetical protein
MAKTTPSEIQEMDHIANLYTETLRNLKTEGAEIETAPFAEYVNKHRSLYISTYDVRR